MSRKQSSDVWRVVDRVTQKHCPTCEARGRNPWHPLDDYSRDAKRGSDVAVHCKACAKEDFARWVAENPEQYAAHVARNSDRYFDEPEAERKRQHDWHARKRARGWHKKGGRWVKENDA